MTMTDIKAVEFTPGALTVINNMTRKVDESKYNTDYTETVRTFAHSLATLIRLGGTVHADGELSLICRNDQIVYGVNWSENSKTWSVNS